MLRPPILRRSRHDRRALLKLLKALTSGDVVMVTRIDRLARSTFDLFAIVKQIVEAGGQCRSLAEPWADSATSTGRLMIAVLGGLADVERDVIRTRTAEGRSRAKAARTWWAASVFGRRSISNGRPYRLYRATGAIACRNSGANACFILYSVATARLCSQSSWATRFGCCQPRCPAAARESQADHRAHGRGAFGAVKGYRERAHAAGRQVGRVVATCEAGWSGFWLARAGAFIASSG